MENAKKVLKKGYGLGLLSLEQAKKFATQMKIFLNLDDKESLALARELVKTSEQASKDVLKAIDKHLSSAIVKSGFASKKEVNVAKKVVKSRVKRVKNLVTKNVKAATKKASKPKKESRFSKLKKKVTRGKK
ncbi:hypothetical protein COV12_02160 [Candidatus Woesearchaeota archaeon CG10_big_fil_rev_8_21_14_0_10_32_24]|nr:MAG: hypothetical protein COV12_02160 [Candidatus Woesearchaeota archaeon CG10_big_fil_rev_8_21_14_0_10_32_24]